MVKPVRLIGRVARAAKRLAGDERGVSAVEFALVLPVMILLYIGGVELSAALSADRKVDSVASTVGDLVAQYNDLSATEISNIFDAASAVMEPHSADELGLIVALVGVDDDGVPVVSWSEARHAVAFEAGEPPPVTIPEDVIPDEGMEIVVATSTYEFSTPFTGFMENITGLTGYTFEHTYYLRPRISDVIGGP